MSEPSNKYKKYEIDPEQYDPESFGRFGANLWNNANELSGEALDALGVGADEEGNKRREMAKDYENHLMFPQRYYIPEDQLQEYQDSSGKEAMKLMPWGGIEQQGLKMYMKRMAPEAQMALREEVFAQPMRKGLEAAKGRIATQRQGLSDIEGKIAQKLEDRMPLTKMGEQPSPDQAKYAQLLQWFKDVNGLR